MNRRMIVFGFRTDAEERQLLAEVAKRLERTEGDTMRFLVRQQARNLGITVAAQNDRETDARGQKQAA